LSRGAGLAWCSVIERHLAIIAILANATFRKLPVATDTAGINAATLSGANVVTTNLSRGAGLAWCSVIERHLAIIAILANATFRKLPVATDTAGINAATLSGANGVATNLSRGAGVAWWRVIERHLAIRAILAGAPFKILPVVAGNK
jgi:hypothetical protein